MDDLTGLFLPVEIPLSYDTEREPLLKGRKVTPKNQSEVFVPEGTIFVDVNGNGPQLLTRGVMATLSLDHLKSGGKHARLTIRVKGGSITAWIAERDFPKLTVLK